MERLRKVKCIECGAIDGGIGWKHRWPLCEKCYNNCWTLQEEWRHHILFDAWFKMIDNGNYEVADELLRQWWEDCREKR